MGAPTPVREVWRPNATHYQYEEIHVTISEKYHFHLKYLRNMVYRIIEILLTIFTSVGALAPAREAWRPNVLGQYY